MSAGAASVRPRVLSGRLRAWSSAAAAVACLAVLVPPLATLVPALRLRGIAAVLRPGHRGPGTGDRGSARGDGCGWRAQPGTGEPGAAAGLVDRLVDRRLRHPELVRTLWFIVLDLFGGRGLADAGCGGRRSTARVAGAGGGGEPHRRSGLGLWLELVESPPLVPRSGHLRRAVLAAVVMWVFWVDAYVVGLSNADWYTKLPSRGRAGTERRCRPTDRRRGPCGSWPR